MHKQLFKIETILRLQAVLGLFTAIFSPIFCQESVFRPGDRVIARNVTFLKNSPKSSSLILDVIERHAPAHVITVQSIWVRVSSNDGKSQGWAKAIEFQIETQRTVTDTLPKTIRVYGEARDALQKHEQEVHQAPLPQEAIKSKSDQQIGIRGIILTSTLSALLSIVLLLSFRHNKQKRPTRTKGHQDGLRKFNELMLAYEGIDTAHKKLQKNISGNRQEQLEMLFEELSHAFNQLAALQKESLNDIEYLKQEIKYLKEKNNNFQ